MQVEELYDLTNWITVEVAEADIVQRYQQLYKVLNQNSQANQQHQPFAEQKDALVQAIESVHLDRLTVGQIDVLRELGIAGNVGKEGVDLVEDVLVKNALDIASAAQRVNQCISELNDGIKWAEQENELLRRILAADEVQSIEDKVLLRVHFSGDAHVDNLTELKDWSKAWWDIGRGISMAHDKSPESIEVIGASKGSIIVSLLTAYAIASTVSGIILASLKVVEKYYDIRRKAQEVRALEIQNGEAERALEEAAENHRESGVEEVVRQTVEELGLDAKKEGDKVSELTSATKKLVDFITKGGEVDFILPDDEDSSEEEQNEGDPVSKGELRIRFEEVRKLEREVKRIEHEGP